MCFIFLLLTQSCNKVYYTKVSLSGNICITKVRQPEVQPFYFRGERFFYFEIRDGDNTTSGSVRDTSNWREKRLLYLEELRKPINLNRECFN